MDLAEPEYGEKRDAGGIDKPVQTSRWSYDEDGSGSGWADAVV